MFSYCGYQYSQLPHLHVLNHRIEYKQYICGLFFLKGGGCRGDALDPRPMRGANAARREEG